jgi:uncharacterized protein
MNWISSSKGVWELLDFLLRFLCHDRMKNERKSPPPQKTSTFSKTARYFWIAGAVILLGLCIALVPRMLKHPAAEDTAAGDVPFTKEGSLQFIKPDGKTASHLDIEIADDANQQQIGLMYRHTMAEDRGMLFIFNDINTRSFWMHNTYLPLDIIYVGPDSTIVSIRPNNPPLNDDHIDSTYPAQFVVEVNAGYAQRHGLQAGDHVHWERQ